MRIRKAALLVVKGPGRGQRLPIPGDAFSIGSAVGNDLRLADDGAVSRRHCRILADERDGYRIEDLGSTNGTFVNGVRVAHAFLDEGARIQLGGTILEFSPQEESRELERSARESFGAAVGRSPAMRRVFHLAESYAPTDATVMLTGETGTGKEILAREIPAHSPRAPKPILVIDCAALSPYLVESEQIAAACGLGVLVDTDRSIRAAGGFIVQLMPGAPEDLITKLEDNIFLMDQLTTILDEDGSDEVVRQVLKDMEPEIVERHGVEYRCYCTRDRVAEALRGVGAQALTEMIEAGEPITCSCQFCDAKYEFSPEELGALL